MFIAVDNVQELLREARQSKAKLQVQEATKIISQNYASNAIVRDTDDERQ